MKKIISLTLSLIMILSIATVGLVSVSAASTDDAQFVLGDANEDGEVDIIDVTIIQRYLANMKVKSFNKKAADIDSDGEVTSIDTLQLQRWLAEMDVPYPIGTSSAPAKKVSPVSANKGIILGDADGDGEVSIIDVTIIQRYVAKMNVKYIDEVAADVDGNGAVDPVDAIFIQRWLVEIKVPYAIGEEIQENAAVGFRKSNDALLGDVNKDGEVTEKDFKAIQGYIISAAPENFDESVADIDGDGEITSIDATHIQRWLKGMNVPYAIGEKLGTKMVLLGDADGDGDVSIIDVTVIQRYLAKMNVKNFDEKAADVDGDGDVTSVDSLLLQKWLVELKVPYEIGKFFPVYA